MSPVPVQRFGVPRATLHSYSLHVRLGDTVRYSSQLSCTVTGPDAEVPLTRVTVALAIASHVWVCKTRDDIS